MKQKLLRLLLPSVVIAGLSCMQDVKADTTILTEADGWRKITEIPENTGDYFFAIVDHSNDLMMTLAQGGQNGADYKSLWYKTSSDPVSDLTKLFCIEKNGSNYNLRNVSYPLLLLQTEWNAAYNFRTHDQAVSIDWADLIFEYSSTNGYWTFENGKYPMSSTAGYKGYLGPWDQNNTWENLTDGQEMACNKQGDYIGRFQIYAISRGDFYKLYAKGASSESPVDLTPLVFNSAFDNLNLSSGTTKGLFWNMNGAEGNYTFNGAVESYHKTGIDISQTFSHLPYGDYEVTVQLGNGDGANTAYLYAKDGAQEVKTPVSLSMVGSNFIAERDKMDADPDYGKLAVNITVTGDELTFGIAEPSNNTWIVFDNFTLSYKGLDLTNVQNVLGDAVEKAMNLAKVLPATAQRNLETIISTNNPSGGYDTADDYVNAANTIKAAYENYQLLVEPYEVYKAMRDDFVKAGILNAEGVYKDKDRAVDALNAAIKAADAAVEAAETAEAVTAQTAAIRAAAMIFVKTVEMTEGKYFDLTYLMVNPGFDDNTTDGWVINKTGDLNTSEQCNEFYQATFDMYQELEGLPNGSYTLSVKAFMRPGWSEDVASDYEKGINKVSAKLYVNNDESVIKNIMEDKQPEKLFSNGTWMDDSFVSGGYVPNCMAGAQKYFEKGLYDTEVAALVNDGKLKLGFKNDVSANGYWIIFDDFRLHYYGASELIYDKQYLVQLKAEAEATLNNALYDKVNGVERTAFGNAISQMPAEETEAAYEAVIDAIKQARENFVAALSAYERLDASIATAKGVDADCADAEKVFAGEETTADEAVAAANALYSDMLSVTAVEFGFGKGEYAPYDHVENIRTLAEAQRALENVASMEVAALDGIVRRVKTMEWTANVTEVNAIYNPTFALSENDGNIAQWTTNDGTVIGGAFHSRAFVIGSDNGNYDNLATFNQEGEIRSCAYFRFDTTNSQTTTEYIYGEVEGYTLPLKGQTLYELSFDGGIWGNNVGDARDVKVIVYDGNNEVLATYRSTFTTRINAGGQASHVDFVFETKDAGNYKIAVTNGNDGWNAMAVSNFQLVETSVASVILSDDKTPNYASGTYSSVNVSRTLYSGLNTFAVPFALDEAAVVEKLGESAAVYELSQAANDELKFAKVASVEPNKPYLVYVESDVTGLQFEDVELSAAEAVTVGNGSWAMVSNYTPKYVHHADYYLLAVQNGKECVAPAGESAYVNGMRAYFLYRGEVENLVNARIVLGDETTSVTVASAGVGQESVDVYDVRGILVRKQVNATEALKGLPKGIYVVNGKKVVR